LDLFEQFVIMHIEWINHSQLIVSMWEWSD